MLADSTTGKTVTQGADSPPPQKRKRSDVIKVAELPREFAVLSRSVDLDLVNLTSKQNTRDFGFQNNCLEVGLLLREIMKLEYV